MKYEQACPTELIEMQNWFASLITRKLSDDQHMQNFTPEGDLMCVEAKKYIIPSMTLEAHQRLELYNQQYWWRLLPLMRDDFPSLIHILSADRFDQEIAIPYLEKYPSKHWSLFLLGERLQVWLKEYYLGKDQDLLLQAARVDWLMNLALIAAASPFEPPSNIMTASLALQDHVALLSSTYPLMSIREERTRCFSKEEEQAILIYRNPHLRVVWRHLSRAEYQVLTLLQKGHSLEEACEKIESIGGSLYDEVYVNIEGWLKSWVIEEQLLKDRTP